MARFSTAPIFQRAVLYVLTSILLAAASIAVIAHQNRPTDQPLSIEREMDSGALVLDRKEAKLRDEFAALVKEKFGTGDSDIPMAFYASEYKRFGGSVMASALSLDRQCHNRAHNLGRVVYEKTGDLASATMTCGTSCVDGCIHGAIMGLIEGTEGSVPESGHVQVSDLSTELKQTIKQICESSSVTRFTGEGDCYHAVGHALAAIGDDEPEAVHLCDIFSEKGIGAEYYCATGYFMQRDLDFGADDAKMKDSLYPCSSSRMSIACYRYKIRRMFDLPSQLSAARGLCESLSGIDRRGCFYGLGFGFYRGGDGNPHAINAVCPEAPATDARMCIEGVAVGGLPVYKTSYMRGLCDAYKGDHAMCLEAIGIESFSMGRNFDLYMAQ